MICGLLRCRPPLPHPTARPPRNHAFWVSTSENKAGCREQKTLHSLYDDLHFLLPFSLALLLSDSNFENLKEMYALKRCKSEGFESCFQ